MSDEQEISKEEDVDIRGLDGSSCICSTARNFVGSPIENSPLLDQFASGSPQYGSLPLPSVGRLPSTRENRPNRRPFHVPSSSLYARYRYYSSLRDPVNPTEHTLLIPDHVVPIELVIPYIPGHVKDSDGKQASYITVIALWNTMMGTSLLTMPWAFGQAGFAGGFIIMISMAGLCLYTAYRMLTLQKTMGLDGEMHEVTYLCRFLWQGSVGKAVEGVAVTFSVVTLLGALIVYWVLMSNFLFNTGEAIYQAASGQSDNESLSDTLDVLCPANNTPEPSGFNLAPFDNSDYFHQWWKQDLTVPFYLLVPFIILLNIRNPKIFTYFNSLGAISVFAMYSFVVAKASHWGFNFSLVNPDSEFYVPLFKDTFMALSGTLSLAYFIHNCIITIMKGNRHPENNVRDMSLAYMLVALTYIPIGVIFYLTFPLPKFCIADNFLDNFPPHNVILAIVRGFLLFQMLTVYPLLTCFVRSQLLSYLLGPGQAHTFTQITIVNVFVLTICVLFAIFYPNIGFIIRWVGAISGLAYIFMLPCVSYLQTLHTKKVLSWQVAVPHVLVILLGIGNFTAQFFLS